LAISFLLSAPSPTSRTSFAFLLVGREHLVEGDALHLVVVLLEPIDELGGADQRQRGARVAAEGRLAVADVQLVVALQEVDLALLLAADEEAQLLDQLDLALEDARRLVLVAAAARGRRRLGDLALGDERVRHAVLLVFRHLAVNEEDAAARLLQQRDAGAGQDLREELGELLVLLRVAVGRDVLDLQLVRLGRHVVHEVADVVVRRVVL